MRRAYLRVARTLAAAGLLGLPLAVGARPDAPGSEEPAGAEARSQTERALARLSALKVELAWLSDPATFPFPLQACPASAGLEVCGFVPDLATKNTALRLARAHTDLTVVDGIALDPSLLGRPAAHDEVALRLAALEVLRSCRASAGLEVRAAVGGRVQVFGSVRSVEEKRNVSRMLLQALGCTHVVNCLTVVPVERQGQTVTLVSADGSLSVAGTVDFRPLDRPVTCLADKRSAESSAPTNWAANRAHAAIGPPEVLQVSASAAPDQDQLPGQLLPDIAKNLQEGADSAFASSRKTIPMPTRNRIVSGSSIFASYESGSPGLLPTSLTDFAVPVRQQHDLAVGGQTREDSDFATVGPVPAQPVSSAQPQDPMPLPEVVAPPGATGKPRVEAATASRVQTSGQKVGSAAGRPVRGASAQVSPLTADGQWPTAFVGGQSMQAPSESSALQVVRNSSAVSPAQPTVSLAGGGGLAADVTTPSQALLARFEEQVATLCGPTVRQIQFRQQNQKVVMVLTVANASVQSYVTSKLKQIPDLAESGVEVELLAPK